jgi:hypothetical protein
VCASSQAQADAFAASKYTSIGGMAPPYRSILHVNESACSRTLADVCDALQSAASTSSPSEELCCNVPVSARGFSNCEVSSKDAAGLPAC